MVRLLLILLICPFLYTGVSFAGFDSEALRQMEDAHVLVKTTCIYSISSASSGKVLAQMPKRFAGNGWFAEHPLSPRMVVTAGHVIDCGSMPEDVLDAFRGAVEQETMVIAQTQARIAVIYKGTEYNAKLFKSSYGEGKPDFAVLLDVDMPAGVQYYKLPVLLEEVYKKYDEAVITGFMPFGSKWEPYLKRVLISKSDNQNIQFSEIIYSGMSGSPVLFYYQGRYHAIGILFAGGFWQQNQVVVPVGPAYATRLKKEFFESDQAAPK